MDHIAIMKKSWGLIPKILSGEKTIESRWYQTRRKPWDSIEKGDRVFLKNSGEPVSTKAKVLRVWQFEIRNAQEAKKIIDEFGNRICLANSDPAKWGRIPKYCILIELSKPSKIRPFSINKKGFGMAAAWICTKDINLLKTR